MTPSTSPNPSTERSRLRLVVVRVLVFSLFATLFARLYYLQVVSGASYHAAAASQSLREVVVQPQRGLIVDDQGRPLVANRMAWAVSVDRTLLDRLPAHDRAVVLKRVATAVGTPAAGAPGPGHLRRPRERRGHCWNGSPYQPVRSPSTYAGPWRCASSSSPRTTPPSSPSSRACAPTPARTA